MRSALVIAVVGLGLAVWVGQAHGQSGTRAEHTFGLGLMLGSPSGLGAKYYLGGTTAVQGGLGVVRGLGNEGLHMHAEFVWHPVVLHRSPSFTLPFYFGVGARLLQHDSYYKRCYDGRYYACNDDDTHLGVRAPVGLLMDFNKIPLDVFLELALVVDVIHLQNDGADHHDNGFGGINAAIGARYYF